MAACRLAAKGKTMADASYDAEVKSILAFLAMQKPAPAPAINPSALDIQPDDYVAPRFVRKLKNKVINTEHCPMSIGLVSVSLSDLFSYFTASIFYFFHSMLFLARYQLTVMHLVGSQ
jgi:hypothetical protein